MENPKRQGFYKVTYENETGSGKMVAAWKELDKATGKRWYQLVAPDGDLTKEKVHEPLEGVTSFVPAKQEEIQALTTRELTLEEKIEKSYQNYLKDSGLWKATRYPVPDSRQVKVGDDLEYGNIHNCKVLAVHENGEVITFSGTRSERGGPVHSIYTNYWLEVFPVQVLKETTLYNAPKYASVQPGNTNFGSLITRVWTQGLNDHPDYQRGYVWTAADEEKFLNSVFSGKNLGMFVFLRHKHPKPEEIFDGKQRLTTMIRLITGQIAYKGVYWHEMSYMDRYRVEGRNVAYLNLNADEFSKAELLQMFLDINSAGVPQTEEHLAHVKQLLAEELAK